MNRFRFRMIVCTLSVLLSAASNARGDDKAVGKRPIRASETLGAQRYAVIIGINDYHDKQVPDLTFAEGDARAVYDVLTDPAVGGIEKKNVTLLLGKSATTRNIRKALAELRTIPKDATVFIFFSGHGAKEAGDAFWVTYDSELGGLAFSAMPDREIRAMTGRIPSNRLIMLLDCCYAAATVKENKSVVDLGVILEVHQRDDRTDGLAGDHNRIARAHLVGLGDAADQPVRRVLIGQRQIRIARGILIPNQRRPIGGVIVPHDRRALAVVDARQQFLDNPRKVA